MPDEPRASRRPDHRVLVTGDAGYIGCALANSLAHAGHDVTVMLSPRHDRRPEWIDPSVEVRTADLLDPHAVGTLLGDGFDEVCHLAGRADVRESFRAPLDYYMTNVVGTLNLLGAMQGTAQPGRLLYLSSSSVYAPGAAAPITEQHRLAPASPYGLSKLATEQAITAQALTGRLGAVVLRCFNVVGAGHGSRDRNVNRFVPRLITLTTAGAGELIVDPGATRDFVHLVDVVDACVRALPIIRPGAVQTFNVGSGVATRIVDLVRLLEQLTGLPVPVAFGPGEQLPGLIADTTAIRQQLAWNPIRSDGSRIIADAWSARLPAPDVNDRFGLPGITVNTPKSPRLRQHIPSGTHSRSDP